MSDQLQSMFQTAQPQFCRICGNQLGADETDTCGEFCKQYGELVDRRYRRRITELECTERKLQATIRGLEQDLAATRAVCAVRNAHAGH
jgi:hypothetical protein